MSSYVLDYALSNTVFRGEQRLAYIAAADSDGRVTKRWGERAETRVTVERISQ